MAKKWSIYIFSDFCSTFKDMHFYASIHDGIAVYKGHAYLVKEGVTDKRKWYGVEHGPDIPESIIVQSMEDYLRA